MKLESLSDLYLILAVLVPGFVYNAVILKFVPLRQNNQKEFALLRFVTASALIFASCSWLIYLVQYNILFDPRSLWKALAWFVIIFLWPTGIALVHARIIQQDGLGGLYRCLRLRPINPVPTGWDWIFGKLRPYFVIVTLNDGTQIPGYFGPSSLASSDPDHKDIFLEKVYTIPEGGGDWVEVERSAGIHIDGAQIAYIEFRMP
jgi:hypothetical protein